MTLFALHYRCKNAMNAQTDDMKQCLHAGCVWHYSATSLALARPSPLPFITQQPWHSVRRHQFSAASPVTLSWMSHCLSAPLFWIWVSPWLMARVQTIDTATHIVTLYALALALQHGLISECDRHLNGLYCLLQTPEKLAGATVHLVHRRSHNPISTSTHLFRHLSGNLLNRVGIESADFLLNWIESPERQIICSLPKTLRTWGTSDHGQFGTSAELSIRHFCTGAKGLYGHFSTNLWKIVLNFRISHVLVFFFSSSD